MGVNVRFWVEQSAWGGDYRYQQNKKKPMATHFGSQIIRVTNNEKLCMCDTLSTALDNVQ